MPNFVVENVLCFLQSFLCHETYSDHVMNILALDEWRSLTLSLIFVKTEFKFLKVPYTPLD